MNCLSIILALIAAFYAIIMSNKRNEQFIKDGKTFSEQIPGSGEFFDKVASSYDLLNQIISLGYHAKWRQAAEQKLFLASSVLDVSTGTADLALSIAKNRSVRIVGLDPSEEMLRLARAKRDSAGDHIGDVTFVKGVAEQLPFEDESFDAVVVAFGVRNFRDRQRGLEEMARVVRKGGAFVVLEASMPREDAFLGKMARMFIKGFVPMIGGIVAGNAEAYGYLRDSMASFPDVDVFVDMLTAAGVTVEEHERLGPFGLGPDLYHGLKS